MERTRVGKLSVVDRESHLIGLLIERDAHFVSTEKLVCERMKPRNSPIVHTGTISLGDAEQVMRERKTKNYWASLLQGTF